MRKSWFRKILYVSVCLARIRPALIFLDVSWITFSFSSKASNLKVFVAVDTLSPAGDLGWLQMAMFEGAKGAILFPEHLRWNQGQDGDAILWDLLFFAEKENKLLLAKAGTDNSVSVMELHGIWCMSHSVSVLNESFFIRAKTVTLPGHFKCHLMNFQFGSIRGPLKRNHAFSPPNLSVLGTIYSLSKTG